MRRMLVAVDGSEMSERVLAVVRDLASSTGAEVELIHVAPPDPDFVGYEVGPESVRNAVAHERREEHRDVQELARTLREGGIAAKGVLVQGPIAEAIVERAERLEADLIVVGSHRRGRVARAVLGSVSEAVVRASTRPVLVVPAGQEGGGRVTG